MTLRVDEETASAPHYTRPVIKLDAIQIPDAPEHRVIYFHLQREREKVLPVFLLVNIVKRSDLIGLLPLLQSIVR